MKLDHPTALLIREVLSKPIDVTDIESDPAFEAEVLEKSKIFYAQYGSDARSLKDVIRSTQVGELGEHGIYNALKDAGVNVVHNDEPKTKQFYWDVEVEGAKCEIKFKGKSFPFLFCFSSKSMDDQLFTYWKKYDYIISFYVKENDGRKFIVPWLLIDSNVVDQQLLWKDAKPYYRDSTKDEGRYLRDEARELGMMVDINVNQNKFTF